MCCMLLPFPVRSGEPIGVRELRVHWRRYAATSMGLHRVSSLFLKRAITLLWDPRTSSANVAYVACHVNVFLPTNGLFINTRFEFDRRPSPRRLTSHCTCP